MSEDSVIQRCPHCHARFSIGPGLFGRRIRCGGCDKVFIASPPPPPPTALPDVDPFDFAKDLPSRSNYRKPTRTRDQKINLVIALAVLAVLAVLALLALVSVLQSGDTSPVWQDSDSNPILLLIFGPIVIVGGVLLYVLPTFVAYSRGHNNLMPIALINVVFGWTLLGWVGSLAWALSSDIKSSRVYVKKVIIKGDVDDDE